MIYWVVRLFISIFAALSKAIKGVLDTVLTIKRIQNRPFVPNYFETSSETEALSSASTKLASYIMVAINPTLDENYPILPKAL